MNTCCCFLLQRALILLTSTHELDFKGSDWILLILAGTTHTMESLQVQSK